MNEDLTLKKQCEPVHFQSSARSAKKSNDFFGLKSIRHFFQFVRYTSRSVQQLQRDYPHVLFRASGFWKTYYTLTGWSEVTEMKRYATSGHHLEAMKSAGKLASKIQTIMFEAAVPPSWREAKEKLKAGKVISYR